MVITSILSTIHPQIVHTYTREMMKRNMAAALKGEFTCTKERLPWVWENAQRDVEQMSLFDYFEEDGLVRLESVPDDCMSVDDLFGDTFDDYHADTIPGGQRTLNAQKAEAYDRLQNEGAWVVESEYKQDGFWHTADCIGGFVGDDFDGSGYEPQVCLAAVEQLFESRGLELPKWYPSKRGDWMRQCIQIWDMYVAMHEGAA